MCLKLDTLTDDVGDVQSGKSFLNRMLELKVEEKPTIEPLGSTSTPLPKSAPRRSSIAGVGPAPPKRGRGRPRRNSLPATASPDRPSSSTPRRKSSAGVTGSTCKGQQGLGRSASKHKLMPPVKEEQPNRKRRRLDGTEKRPSDDAKFRTTLMTPPKKGKNLTYAQKQYQSVWLAVPPSSDEHKRRPPPKRRASDAGKRSKSPTSVTAATKRAVSKLETAVGRSSRKSLPVLKPLALDDTTVSPVKKASLLKQKVRAYPRTRVHFYNRVVKAKSCGKAPQYYFVLQYDEESELIKIVPMEARGKLTGKREGRPRYQALIGDNDANFKVVKASDYQVVPATMVMKTPVVSQEAWDVEDQDS